MTITKRSGRATCCAVAVVLATCLLLGTASYSAGGNAEGLRVYSVPLAGVDLENSIAFGFGRYVFIAPSAPSKEDPDSLADLDNNWLIVVDTKKPNQAPQRISLGNCYYPSEVLFDEQSAAVFVRGTEFVSGVGGAYTPSQVVVYLHLRLSEKDGWPELGADPIVKIPIAGRGQPVAESAPPDIRIGQKGKVLVYTNGASFFTYNLDTGAVYQKDVIVPREFSEDNRICYLDIDQQTNTVVIATTTRKPAEGGGLQFSSELLFYELELDGTLNLLKQVPSEKFPSGSSLPEGSNVVVMSDAESGAPESALFVTDRGALCQVYLDRGSDLIGTVEVKDTFDILFRTDPRKASPTVLKYDASSRVLAVTKQGYIRKPANGRPGRPGGIRKPANLRFWMETPGLLLVQLGKRNKVVREKDLSTELQASQGLSDFVFEGSAGFVSTYRGELFQVDVSRGVLQASIREVGQMGAGIDSLSYFPSRSTFVALSPLEADADGDIVLPGKVVLARLGAEGNAQSVVARKAGNTQAGSEPGRSGSGIRRPGNVTTKDSK